jgi:thymidylate synthase ThyX
MNLRQVFHLCRLRGASNAHFSIQRVAQQIAEAVAQVYPSLGKYLDLPQDVSWRSIEAEYFSQIAAR